MPLNFLQYLIIFLIIVAIGGKDLVMAIARKMGWINGNNNSDLKKQLTDIQENHLHDISKKMDEQVVVHEKILLMLMDIRDKIK